MCLFIPKALGKRAVLDTTIAGHQVVVCIHSCLCNNNSAWCLVNVSLGEVCYVYVGRERGSGRGGGWEREGGGR